MTQFSNFLKNSKKYTSVTFAKAEDILIVVGGVIPQQDYEFLYINGANFIFGPGTNLPKSACEILEKYIK